MLYKLYIYEIHMDDQGWSDIFTWNVHHTFTRHFSTSYSGWLRNPSKSPVDRWWIPSFIGFQPSFWWWFITFRWPIHGCPPCFHARRRIVPWWSWWHRRRRRRSGSSPIGAWVTFVAGEVKRVAENPPRVVRKMWFNMVLTWHQY